MDRIRKQVSLLLAAALVVVLAACSTPDSAGFTFDEGAGTLGTSSKLSWSYGSAILTGQITGLGSSEVDVEGLAVGGYPAQCTNGGGNPPPPFLLEFGNGNDLTVYPNRRGVVKFGSKKNEEGFEIPNYDFADFDKADYVIVDGKYRIVNAEIVSDACGNNGNGWYIEVDTTIWYITSVFLRYGVDEGEAGLDDDPYTAISWTCETTPIVGASAPDPLASLSCTLDEPVFDPWAPVIEN